MFLFLFLLLISPENLSAWERYEGKRDDLCSKFEGAKSEYGNTHKIFSLTEGVADHKTRVATAATIRKDIEATFSTVSDANDILARMMQDLKKAELADEVIKCDGFN